MIDGVFAADVQVIGEDLCERAQRVVAHADDAEDDVASLTRAFWMHEVLAADLQIHVVVRAFTTYAEMA
jgi:hypothetical protein